MTPRLKALFGVLLGAGAWSAWVLVHRGEAAAPAVVEATAAAARKPASMASTRGAATGVALQPVSQRPAPPIAAANPFAPRPWVAPPPPPVVAVAPPPPAAVPAPLPVPAAPPPLKLPFRLVGMVEDGVAAPPRVFLALNDKLIIATPGDQLEGGFRLDAITATELVFTHVQQNQQLRLSLQGAAS